MPKQTAADIVQALRADYGLAGSDLAMEEWALLTEVPLSVPKDPTRTADTYWGRNERTIDVLLLRNWSGGKGFERFAIEIKVSRSDYKNETDDKRAPAWANAHRCAYACPPGLIVPADLPDGWGLMWVHPEPITDVAPTHPTWHKHVEWKRKPVRHDPEVEPLRLMHVLARRASRAEERIRRGEEDGADVAALRREVDRLHARLANRDSAVARERERVRDAMRRLRAQGDNRCADCHEPVKPAGNARRDYRERSADGFWTHVEVEAGNRCRMARSEAERLKREAETGSRYSYALDYSPHIETEAERLDDTEIGAERRADDAAYDALTTTEDVREEYRYA